MDIVCGYRCNNEGEGSAGRSYIRWLRVRATPWDNITRMGAEPKECSTGFGITFLMVRSTTKHQQVDQTVRKGSGGFRVPMTRCGEMSRKLRRETVRHEKVGAATSTVDVHGREGWLWPRLRRLPTAFGSQMQAQNDRIPDVDPFALQNVAGAVAQLAAGLRSFLL